MIYATPKQIDELGIPHQVTLIAVECIDKKFIGAQFVSEQIPINIHTEKLLVLPNEASGGNVSTFQGLPWSIDTFHSFIAPHVDGHGLWVTTTKPSLDIQFSNSLLGGAWISSCAPQVQQHRA
jgi:hypothetical protein